MNNKLIACLFTALLMFGAAVRADGRAIFQDIKSAPESKPLAIVDALDYGQTVTPGGYAAAFSYSAITENTLAAPLGQPSFDLGGVHAALEGEPVQLLFVSPRQVNLLLPPDAPLGVHKLRLYYGARVFAGDVTIVANRPRIITDSNNVAYGFVFPVGVNFAMVYGTGVTVRVDQVNQAESTGSVWLVTEDNRIYEAVYSGPARPPVHDWQFVFVLPGDLFERSRGVEVRLRVCPTGAECVESLPAILQR